MTSLSSLACPFLRGRPTWGALARSWVGLRGAFPVLWTLGWELSVSAFFGEGGNFFFLSVGTLASTSVPAAKVAFEIFLRVGSSASR